MSPANPLTMAMLLGLPELSTARLVGGASGLSGVVDGLDLVSMTAGTLARFDRRAVVVPLGGRPGFELDVAVRFAADRGAAGIFLGNIGRAPASTSRLADALGLVTVALQADDLVATAWRLARAVGDPQLPAYELLAAGLDAIKRARPHPEDITAALTRRAGIRTAVLAGDGSCIAGESLNIPDELLQKEVGGAWPTVDGWVVVWPVAADQAVVQQTPALWLALELPASHSESVKSAERLASTAAAKLELWVARERLLTERDTRRRVEALTELMSPDGAASLTRERALSVGFRLDGWHTGVYLRAPSPAGSQLVLDLEVALRAELDTGPLVALRDGYATWVTDRSDPAKPVYRERTAALRSVLSRTAPDRGLTGGIGRPYEGMSGVSHSLTEAMDAALFASFDGARGPVQHIDELGVRRALSEWYRAESFRAHAADLLAPLTGAGEIELARTLGAFLDNESSPSATASAIGVHRNTVLVRISRAEQLLNIQLTNADDRLLLQLACRVLGFGSTSGSALRA